MSALASAGEELGASAADGAKAVNGADSWCARERRASAPQREAEWPIPYQPLGIAPCVSTAAQVAVAVHSVDIRAQPRDGGLPAHVHSTRVRR